MSQQNSLDDNGVTSGDRTTVQQSAIENLNNSEHRNDSNDSTETNQNRDPQPPQSESTNTGFLNLKGFKTYFTKDAEDTTSIVKVTFHVHLPSFKYVEGYPIIVGNIDELGNWEEPIVKLKQQKSGGREYMHGSKPSYWYSDPISITIDKFSSQDAKYNYAFFVPKPKPEEKKNLLQSLFGKSDENKDDQQSSDSKTKPDKNKEEGDLYLEDGPQRSLMRNGSQFDQFDKFDLARSFRIKDRSCELRPIREFMFLDIIYNNITSSNLREKIMEYQELLNRFNKVTLEASNFEFIESNIQKTKAKEYEKRIFLCLLLGYHVNWQNQNSISQFSLPIRFPMAQIIDTLEKFKPDILPEEFYFVLSFTMKSVIRLNVAHKSFDWLRLFEFANNIDPNFTFIDAIQDLRLNDERMNNFLEKFIKFAKPIMNQIKDLMIYSNIGRWLFNNCSSLETLLFIWTNVIDHTIDRDIKLLKHFRFCVERLISSSNVTGLKMHLSRMPVELYGEVAEIFRMKSLSLLKNRGVEWNKGASEAILQILIDPKLKWPKDEFLEAMELISVSSRSGLLLKFPDLLDYWFKSSYKDLKTNKLPNICKTWYHHLIDINGSESYNVNDSKFIYDIYYYLSVIFPIVGKHDKILKELLDVAADRVKNCAASNILNITPAIAKNLQKEIYSDYGEMVKAMLKKSVHKVDNGVIKNLLLVCGCKDEVLYIQNVLSEDIVYHVMTYLEAKDTIINNTNMSITILHLLKLYRLWKLIFNATGRVENLHSHYYVKRVQGIIFKFADIIIDQTITIRSLQEILEYDTEILFNFFNFSVKKEKISVDLIKILRKDCHGFMLKKNQLRIFYDNFCPIEKVTDVQKFLDDINNRNNNLEKITLKEVLAIDYWNFHKNNLSSAKEAYRVARLRTFRNVFDTAMPKEKCTVEYIAQTLIPAAINEFKQLCQQYKEWEKLKCSEGSVLWKNVINVEEELNLMADHIQTEKTKKLIKTLEHLSLVPTQIERLQYLSAVVVMFKVIHTREDWLERLQLILRDDYLWLGKLVNFFDIFKHHLGMIDDDCWDLIKELSKAGEFIVFLHKIAEHDITNLINTVDEASDERLLQEDTVSSLIQVQHFLHPLIKSAEKLSLKQFLNGISKVTQQNAKLGSKIALCSSNNMALQNLYNNVSNKGEVTREKIRSAVKKGTYTFERDYNGDTCKVTLSYARLESTKITKNSYSLNELHDLRGRALLISKPSVTADIATNHAPGMEAEEEISKPIMDEFVIQVDMAQEIINIATKLIQMGHFYYRTYKREIKGSKDMQIEAEYLRVELKEWKEIVNEAQEEYYYLNFFPARHIWTFLDYFSINKNNKDARKNAKECEKLIRFVNNGAKLPPKSDENRIHLESKYEQILGKIGTELQGIFGAIPKEENEIKNIKERVISDVVYPGKLFVGACNNKSLVPNIIMSLYVNHGCYPLPWQILICTASTTMEELEIFVKRCFFAKKNGYDGILFCLANLELLEFELQYNLVNLIRSMREGHNHFRLALICYREQELHHHILDQFSQDVQTTNGLSGEAMTTLYRELCHNIVSITSELSGQGKTELVRQGSFSKKLMPKSFLISDGSNFGTLVRGLKEFKIKPFESLHLNIVSADNPEDVNLFLFEILTLRIVFCNMDVAVLPNTFVFIEVASTLRERLFKSLPIVRYFRPVHLTWDIGNLIVSQEINSQIQVVCHYLKAISEKAAINEKDIYFKSVEETSGLQPLSTDECRRLIEEYLFRKNTKGVKDVKGISSFRFIEIFVNVFADQLVRLSSSSFFQVENLGLMVKENNIRSTLVQTLLTVSKDFATKSIATKEAQKQNVSSPDDENAALGNIVQWDDSNHLLVFFLSQTPDSICALYRDKAKVPKNVKDLLKSQSIGDKEWDLDDYNKMDPKTLLSILENLARKTMHKINYPQYALSADNLIKMALILLRARANIPVIVCGEAGCGKTSLMGFLAKVVEVEFRALNLHAGVVEDNILHFMGESQEIAEKGEVWLFFDEINTCNHIGLLADLIAHRTLNGKPIHHNIRLFAACNPYRIRTKAATTAGLLKRKDLRFEEKSKLVYQVKPLPDQILDYVWDYGVLKPKEEQKYIEIMVNEQLKGHGHKVFSECLFESQGIIREIEESYSVSLRDVKRAIILFKFFINSFKDRPHMTKHGDVTTRSYVLALGLCYQSRIYEQRLRKSYRDKMGKIFKEHKFSIDEAGFNKIIREEQEDYINRMQCPPNTAKNEALLENVLAMIVCILTKLPCFIIGAPGSSKSLAVRLVSQNLKGSDSNDEYFRKLPQVYLIPHQGSSSSTSEGIKKVFDKAVAYQETSSKEFPVLSVVLLDEVGLAETSPFNPLKVLHSLLEPSYPNTEAKVSCVAISNWRLDNSKSSRALLVQRPKFELDDLTDTASRLLTKDWNSQITKPSLELLAKSYLDYEQHGQILSNFHGLRDYYSLVKSLSQNSRLTPENIQLALVRNFGGIDNIEVLIGKYFRQVMRYFNSNDYSYKPIPTWDLINANLADKDARHLMVIGKSDSIVNLLNYQLRKKNLDPVVILGSQFPEDQDDYSYSVLSRIMMCVETGRPLILTDLEIIYGSLYDLWNQNYIVVGSEDDPKYYARVALGAYANPMLYVAPTFRCILVMDESKLEKADPPLLNRFEKQKMNMNDILTPQEHELVDSLGEWTRLISYQKNISNNTDLRGFEQKDLFVGFDENETLQSLVIDVKKNFPESEDDEVLFKCKEKLIKIASSDGIIRAERSNSDEVRQWKDIYFNEQHHDNLIDHIQHQLAKYPDHNNSEIQEEEIVYEGLQIIINTFSNINAEVESCLRNEMSCQVDKLSTFKTESQFQNRIKNFWIESYDEMLILQCDVTTVNAGCIKLAKFLIEQYRNEYLQKKRRQLEFQQEEAKKQSKSSDSNPKNTQQTILPTKHVCIILHIHREQEDTLASFNFMCGWDQITIETLLPQEKDLSLLLNENLSDLISTTYPFEEILKHELLWCLLCIKYPSNIKSVEHIKMLNEKICENPILVNLLKAKSIEWLEENSNNTNWQYEVASNKKLLYPYSSLTNALLARIRSVVRKPIAKLLYALEKYAAIHTIIFLYNKSLNAKGPAKSMMEDVDIEEDAVMDDDAYLLEFWNQMVNDDDMISIKEIRIEPSPDSYVMPHGVYELEFPFSYYIMKKIDDSRRVYEEELLSLHNDPDNIDQTTGELFGYVVEGYNKKFINNLEKSPIIMNSPIANYPEKYFKDFINVILSNEANGGGGIGEKDKDFDEKLLKFIFERRLGEKNVLNPIRLHSYWWKNSSSILAELTLAQMSPDVITRIEKENDDNKILLDIEFERHLVEQVIRNLLDRIINTKEGEQGSRNRLIIERWQYEVTKVLSLCEKIDVSSKLHSLQLLKICNDLLIAKSIPLDDMKQIIKHAQQQNMTSPDIISEEFINVVMVILNKLKPNEKNLIPRRLFILRCLNMLTLESPVRLYLYKELFSSLPFPLMGTIISNIFKTEEKEYPNSILQLVRQPNQILQYSGRLSIINKCFNISGLNTMMATLICDTLQQEFFSKLDIINLVDGFNSAIGALYGNYSQPLQRIASVAFLKEFTKQFWDCLIKNNKDYLRPITHNLLEVENFNGTLLVEQMNGTLSMAHPLINAFKLYLLRELRINRELSSDDIKKFCEAQSNLNWFNNIDTDVKDESRLPFNPYWAISDYEKLEIAYTSLYNTNNRSQFNTIFKQYDGKVPNSSDKMILFGVIVVKLHYVRASREWRDNENRIFDYFSEKITDLTTIPEYFKRTLHRIMTNKQSLLRINQVITNSQLLMKSVIAHIIGLHVTLDPNTTPLSMYMHKIKDAQNTFILTCKSDIESMMFSAIAEKENVSRYSCQCGYKYLIGECGEAWTVSKCPECKRTIGGISHIAATGNKRIDAANQNKFEANDQTGYISEGINKEINYTTRDMPPVAYRILHLIVHAIIGSQVPSQAATTFIQQHNKNYTNVEGYCTEHIINDWDILKKILNCSDENLALTFHSIILALTDNPPAHNSMLNTSNDRNQWETIFTRTCVLPFTRSVNETCVKFRAQLEQNMKKVDMKGSILEGQIYQTNLMDENYLNENLPSLWRIIGKINYSSFRAYYTSEPENVEKYPFLNIFFKHSKALPLIKHLYPMVKFIQLLNTKLGYKLSRDEAKNLSFRKFIEDESNGDEDKDTYNALRKSFNEFQEAYNTIIQGVKRYQCHNLPKVKPHITDKDSVVYGLVEGKDEGIFLCAILEYLINIQNNFLGEIILIPPGTCDSLRFLQSPSWDDDTSSADNPPYCVRTMRVDHAIESNFVIYNWNEEILQYSQRNLGVGKGQEIIYDLQCIENEIANDLVRNKVHFEIRNEQLALDPFPYHLELFSSSMRILGDIKSLIPQEQIPSDKLSLITGQNADSYVTFSSSSSTSKDNFSELLCLLEILLCFIKRTSIGDGELRLSEFINQWVQLSSLKGNTKFNNILSCDLQLKHIVSLYEVIEEQVANTMIQFIDKKFKERLSDDMKDGLDDAIDFDGGNKEKIPVDSFIITMKRFIQRVLQTENDKEVHTLCTYMTDMSLNLWPSNIIEEVLDGKFPNNLYVANSVTAYEYVLKKKETSKPKQKYSEEINDNKPTFDTREIASSSFDSNFLRPLPTRSNTRKGRKTENNKFDVM